MESMAYSWINRISRVVVTALVIASVGLALLSTGAVHAQDNEQQPGSMGCAPFGTDGPPTIPEGTVIKVDGSYWQCMRGSWWKLPKGSSPVPPSIVNLQNVSNSTIVGGVKPASGQPAQDKYLENGRF